MPVDGTCCGLLPDAVLCREPPKLGSARGNLKKMLHTKSEELEEALHFLSKSHFQKWYGRHKNTTEYAFEISIFIL